MRRGDHMYALGTKGEQWPEAPLIPSLRNRGATLG
jgi:hypothetical protein